MTRYYYKKTDSWSYRLLLRLFAILIIVFGLGMIIYVSLPIISWKIYFAPVFASEDIISPIPKTTIVTNTTFGSLISSASQTLGGTNYQNAQNWFPTFNTSKTRNIPKITQYSLTIPKLGITNAIVSAIDYDLDNHLVHYGGTAFPPNKGNAVIFGHSTLPQLFDVKNYKTIFANAYKLGIGDEIIATLDHVSYRYTIKTIIVVDPDNTSIFSQNFDAPYLTLVTCTPPGTIWKRLILRAELQNI